MSMVATLKEIMLGFFLTSFAPSSSVEPYDVKVTSLFLPINQTRHEKNDFQVRIPTNFIPAQTLEQAEKQGFFQFFPQADDTKLWTKKITVHTFRNIQTMVETNFMNFVKLQFLQRPGTKILEEDIELLGAYAKSTLSVIYQDKDRPVLVHMIYYFGPRDFAGIQFAQVFSGVQDINQTLLESKKFIENYTQIIHQDFILPEKGVGLS